MLHQHRHITRWRSAFQENREVRSYISQHSRELSVIQQSHQHVGVAHINKSACDQASITRNNLLGFSCTSYFRNYSKQKSNFFTRLIDNIKQDMEKNKEMKENIKKFREEAEKLEQSEALKKARAKYMTVENEASVLKAKLDKVKSTVAGVIEEAGKSDIAKKAGEGVKEVSQRLGSNHGKISEEIGKSARDAAESISAKSQKLGATGTFKTITEATAAVRDELEQTGSQARIYVAPTKLRKRLETPEGQERVFEADATTMDIELHKDSRFYESWQNFKNNNPYVNKILDWKMKYEESENPVIRVSRLFTDKMSYVVGGLFQNTETSNALTEIVKIDPSFRKDKFLLQCETDIIPNILEAIVRGDLDILRDWCHDAPYNLLSAPIKAVKSMGARFDSKILDIEGLDLAMGRIMDQNPVLIITFTCQQIQCVRDKNNKVIEGDPEKVLRVNYVWALSRDKSVLDPKGAWRLLDISANSVQQLV